MCCTLHQMQLYSIFFMVLPFLHREKLSSDIVCVILNYNCVFYV